MALVFRNDSERNCGQSTAFRDGVSSIIQVSAHKATTKASSSFRARCSNQNPMTPLRSTAAPAAQILPLPQLSVRLLVVYFAALAPSLGTALSAVGRLALYLTAFAFIFSSVKSSLKLNSQLHRLWISLILLTVSYMALSTAWSSADAALAGQSWSRHARLLTIPIVVALIQSRAELVWTLRVFVAGQVFVLLSSWLLVAGVNLPWATAAAAMSQYAVFGSYLEQSMTETVLAIILWFMRDTIFGRQYRYLAVALAVIAVIHVFSSLLSRTGHLMCIAFLSYAAFLQTPKRLRALALLLPAGFLLLAYFGSSNVATRLNQAASEVKSYRDGTAKSTSNGQRLAIVGASLTLISDNPIFGYGAGSWNNEYVRTEGSKIVPGTETFDNPHNVAMLWAVEGGLVGLGLLCASLVTVSLTSRRLEPEWKRTFTAMLLVLVVASMFTSTIYGIGLGDFFCVGIGLMLCAASYSSASSAQNDAPHD